MLETEIQGCRVLIPSSQNVQDRRVSENTPVLEITNLEFAYGSSPVLKRVSLRVMRKEVVALLGANGVGKTTALRLVAGLEHDYRGQIAIGGVDRAADGKYARSRISYLPDEPLLYELLSPLEYLEFVGALRELSADYVIERSEPLAVS